MSNSNLYIFNGTIVNESHHIAYMNLLKILFRLDVLDEETVIDLAMEFRPFFV